MDVLLSVALLHLGAAGGDGPGTSAEAQATLDSAAHGRRTARDILDCQSDPEWAGFLRQLRANRDDGFPEDPLLAWIALQLVQRDLDLWSTRPHEEVSTWTSDAWENLVQDMCGSASAEDASATASARGCYYGDWSARWVIARHHRSFLRPTGMNLSHMFEGEVSKDVFSLHTFFSDWVEESSWPVAPLDMLATAGRCCSQARHSRRRVTCRGAWPRNWRLLHHSDVVDPRWVSKLPSLPEPPKGWYRMGDQYATVGSPSRLLGRGVRSRAVYAWEFGIHKTLSAEILTTLHRALSARAGSLHARNIVTHQYPARMPKCPLYLSVRMNCDMQTDEANAAVAKYLIWDMPWEREDGIHSEIHYNPYFIWGELQNMSSRLESALIARPPEGGLDLLVITHPIVFLAAVKLSPSLRSVPTLLYLSSALYYMTHPAEHQRLRELFATEARRPGNLFVAAEAWIRRHLEHLGGVDLPVRRGLSLYTGVAPQPKATRGLLVLGRDVEDRLLSCLIRRRAGEVRGATAPKDIVFRGELKGSRWSQMASFRAAAIFPYTFFTLSFEELYCMAVPILVPRHFSKHVYSGVYAQFPNAHPPLLRKLYDPWNAETFHSLVHTEYFCRPLVARFDSLADLLWRTGPLRAPWLVAVRETMATRAVDVRRSTLAFWRGVLAV